MNGFTLAFSEALALLIGFDHRVAEIVLLSLQVSGLAVCLGTLVGLPLGCLLYTSRCV